MIVDIVAPTGGMLVGAPMFPKKQQQPVKEDRHGYARHFVARR